MDSAEPGGAADEPSAATINPDPNPISNSPPASDAPSRLRTPFTSLSQVDADLALARALQDQERAYVMLGRAGQEHVASEADGYDYGEVDGLDAAEDDEWSDYDDDPDEEDAFDANDDRAVDRGEFESDEAFARALRDAEEREVAVRLMALAGLNDWADRDFGDHGRNQQDGWQEVDPDELSYEELIALGEVVGTESRGLSADIIATLPSVTYKAQITQDGNSDQCVVCHLDYEDGDSLIILSCRHMYHPDCINKWLQINKVCPICSAEVSPSENRRE